MAVLPRLPVLVPFSIIMNFPTLLSTMARFAPGMTNALPMSLAAYGAISSLVAFALSILVLALAGPAGGVFVNETLPFIAIFKRTSQLLDGNRWRFVLTLLPMILIATVLETVLEIWLIRSGVQKSIRVASALIVSRWLNECLFVLIAVGYRDLRRIVDSGQPDQVAAVFD